MRAPRLLTLSWIYGERPADEVELRLTPGSNDDTWLELEHATVTQQVEWEGQLYDSILGVGTRWEPTLTYSLTKYLMGEFPDVPLAEWYEPTSEHLELQQLCDKAWMALVGAGGNEKRAN